MSDIDLTKVDTNEFAVAMAQAFSNAMAPILKQLNGGIGQKATVGTNPPPNNLVHGAGGFLGGVAVGMDPEVVSAMMHWMGLSEYVPVRGVRTTELLLPFITGVEAVSSTEPTTVCGDCISGETEACLQHFPTGRVCRETKEMDIDRIIERLNTGDIDLTLLNDQLGNASPWHPGDSIANLGSEGLMQVATAWALMFELPPLFMSALTPMVYTGNPTNNTAGYKEFRGLNLLINTGFVDAIANVTCPALDSDIKDFNYGDVETQTSPSFFQMLEMAEYYVHFNAIRQRLAPVQHAVVMRPELWQILSGLVPVQTILSTLGNLMGQVPAQMEVTVDGAQTARDRDTMRREGFLNLNGRRLPVITDDGIEELNNANNANLNPGEYASDVYIVPLKYLGNRDAIRIEYKDFRYINNEVQATDGLIGNFYRPSGDGRFAYTWVKNSWCFKIQAKIEPRIILRTPQLAARIQHVKYVPLQHLRSPDQDSPYWVKGGVSTRAPRSYYY